MRGKLSLFSSWRPSIRITPAHAGKTLNLNVEVITKKDHPRACGENQTTLSHAYKNLGSPPRMRGKRRETKLGTQSFRITPAHAGKTVWVGGKRFNSSGSPRACGENSGMRFRCRGKIGSPPRMRGKHFGNGVFPWLILVLSLDPL